MKSLLSIRRSYSFLRSGKGNQYRNLVSNPINGFQHCVGSTPLLYLSSASKEAGCNIFGKAEFQNPGGSVKDRPALWMILNAEKQGLLHRNKPGFIVEGTSGNTGIGLSIIGKMLGYNVIVIIPNNQSNGKKEALKRCGATLIEVDGDPEDFTRQNHYVHYTKRFALNLKKHLKAMNENIDVFYSNQWDNLSNQQSHFESTGPEIYNQTNGKIDLFSCAVGTGGSLCGIGRYLKSKNKNISVCLTAPNGCDMFNYFVEGKIYHDAKEKSIVEGIGLNGRVTNQLNELQKHFTLDYVTKITDKDMMKQIINLQKYDGLMVGLSTGINVAGAIQCAKYFKLNKNNVVVTTLNDKAQAYSDKIFNQEFLKENNLPFHHSDYGGHDLEKISKETYI
eukprot:519958_1